MIKLWWHRFTTIRVNFQRVPYTEAAELIAQGWEIAKEEDTNIIIGFVYLEQRI